MHLPVGGVASLPLIGIACRSPLIGWLAGASVPEPLSCLRIFAWRLTVLFLSLLWITPQHLLRPLLLPLRAHSHNLWARSHPYSIPQRDKFTNPNFIRRMLLA